MRTYIYMNNAIRERRPKRKVVVVQRGERRRSSNTVKLVDPATGKVVGFVKFRERRRWRSPYQVRAWVELTHLVARV